MTTATRVPIESVRRAISRMLGAERRLRSRDHGGAGELTYAQMRSIAALGREREMTAGQLARSADLNPASVTALIDRLEAADLVQRHRSTEDRRVCNVSLTPEGWSLFERKMAAWQALWEQNLDEFSDDELDVASRVIERLAEMYESLPGPRGD
jgi:DNA-binding MarR family transcriptional regulator